MTEEEQQQGRIAINVSPQNMTIQITPQPIALMIDEANMKQMAAQILAAHPDFFDELVKARVTQKKTELAIIRDIKASKLN